MVLARVGIADTLQLRVEGIVNANSVCGYSKTVVQAPNILTHISVWIVGSSVGDVNDVDAVSSRVKATGWSQHEIADTSSCTTSVGVPGPRAVEVVVNRCHGFTSCNSSTASVVVAVEAELDKILVVKRHHSNLDGVAEKEYEFTQSSGDSVESGLLDASRGVQHKEDVLHAVGEAGGLAPVSCSMLSNVEGSWVNSQRFRLWVC